MQAFSRILLSLAGFVGPSFGAVYHVAPEGHDSNRGTESKPFRTIGKAAGTVVAGDTIILADGTYHSEGHTSDGTGGQHGYATPVAITKAGRADAWITLRAQNKGRAVLDCDESPQNLGCDVFITLKRGSAYWSFEDLTVIHAAFAGINTNEGASHVRIRGCKFEDIGNRNDSIEIGIVGVGFGPPEATDWQIEDSIFHHIGRTGGHYPSLDHGIYARGSNVVIRNNLFYQMEAGWGIQTSSGARNWLIENNTFASPNPKAEGQIMLWDGGHPESVSDITIRSNIFYQPRKSAIVTNGAIASCRIEDNVTTAEAIIDGRNRCDVSRNAIRADLHFSNAPNGAHDFRLAQDSPAAGHGWNPDTSHDTSATAAAPLAQERIR